jgi:predicted amidohydrolase YtcJ
LRPGFGDAHVGLISGSLSLDAVDLAGAVTQEEIRQRIASYAKANPEARWIVGRGWTYAAFPVGLPEKALLDAVVSDRPAFLVSYDGHTGWAIPGLAPPPGSRSAKDPPAVSSCATGTASPRAPSKRSGDGGGTPADSAPTPDRKVRALKRGLDLAASHGLTTVHDLP